jgi:uncharacterized protein (DUF1697 family)
MNSFVALLRAVNVGGTGKLAMTDLKSMGEAIGGKNVRTYIASGNLLLRSSKSEAQVKAALEAKLKSFTGKPVDVIVRTGDEMAKVIAANPFSSAPGNRVMAIFLDEAPPRDVLKTVTGKGLDEEVALGKREIYVRYGDGMGHSKLRIPLAKEGTARNMNTVAKLVEMAGEDV